MTGSGGLFTKDNLRAEIERQAAEIARLHIVLGEIANTSAWPANEMAREALGE